MIIKGSAFIITTPKLRFNGFNEPWQETKLGKLVNSFDYGLNASAKKYDGKNQYLRITDIDDNTRLFNYDNLTTPNTDLTNKDNYTLKPGNIVFARTGASTGKTYLYHNNDKRVYFAGFLIRADINKLSDSNFIFNYTLTTKYSNFIKINSMRSGQPGINSKELGTLKINIPTIQEQTKIGLFFDKLDKLINLQQSKVNALKSLKNGYLQKLFVGMHSNTPQLRFKGFNDPYVLNNFGKVTVKLKSYSLSRNYENENGKYKYIHYGDIHTTKNGLINRATPLPSIEGDNYETLKSGDAVLADASEDYKDVAKTVVLTDIPQNKIVAGLHTIALRLNNINPIYFYYLMKTDRFKHFAYQHGTGLKVFGISYNELSKFIASIPPTTEEQTKIGFFMASIDKQITSQEEKLNHLKATKRGFLQKLFV